MLRLVVTVLVGLPLLLLPPGMCICRVTPQSLAKFGTRLASRAKVPFEAYSVFAGVTAQPIPERDDPTEHNPGCPAMFGVAPAKLTAPDQLSLDPPAAAAFVAVASVETNVDWCHTSLPITFVPIASQPLYVYHCALLI
ncbi:hypothetical protein [Fimbriiglobus ruber]|uniref:Uncharacterized protein n=1 Tax=Fimbriiglobus ruber TaxID=1908690 RepID=A0A225D2E4_9BACT|nr:hypothetical protein [Fimbriiglobus ruber]OWK35113.1 hypothetical protein FRUB_09955 [Fimbriiglobus ruber]